MAILKRKILRVLLLAAILIMFQFSTWKDISSVQETAIPLIVSMGTVFKRLHHELPISVTSLLEQDIEFPIHIYIPDHEDSLFQDYLQHHPESILNHPRVTFHSSDIPFASAKFMDSIRSFKNQSVAMVVCDDDHYFAPTRISTLYHSYLQDPEHAYGFRGWRIRPDFEWGVTGDEVDYHIIFGHLIQKPYQVGILTANLAYIVNTAWFTNSTVDTFSQDTPLGAKYMDDIYMNGHLSQLGIKRFVIPSDLHLNVEKAMPINDEIGKKGMTRYSANTEALRYFQRFFEKENIPYQYGGDNGPSYKNLLIRKMYFPLRERWLELYVWTRFTFWEH